MTKFKQILTVAVTAAALAFGASSAMAAKIAVVGGSNDDAFWNKIKKLSLIHI